MAAAQREQGLRNVESPLESDPQLSKSGKPRMRALHNPTMFAQPLTALNTSSCNTAQDAFGPQIGRATEVVIALCLHAISWGVGEAGPPDLSALEWRQYTARRAWGHAGWRH